MNYTIVKVTLCKLPLDVYTNISMFSHLMDFKYKRSFTEVIGFYLFFQFASLLVVAILFSLLRLVLYRDHFFVHYLGEVVSLVTTTLLGLGILYAKRRLLNILLLGSLVASIAIAHLYGAALSFIPVSFFTMLRPKKD